MPCAGSLNPVFPLALPRLFGSPFALSGHVHKAHTQHWLAGWPAPQGPEGVTWAPAVQGGEGSDGFPPHLSRRVGCCSEPGRDGPSQRQTFFWYGYFTFCSSESHGGGQISCVGKTLATYCGSRRGTRCHRRCSRCPGRRRGKAEMRPRCLPWPRAVLATSPASLFKWMGKSGICKLWPVRSCYYK